MLSPCKSVIFPCRFLQQTLKWDSKYVSDGVWIGLKLNKTTKQPYWQNNEPLEPVQ